jgi:hypothetical protein
MLVSRRWSTLPESLARGVLSDIAVPPRFTGEDTDALAGRRGSPARPVSPRHGLSHVKRITELESRQLSLYQALTGKDQLFQNERRNYVERIKKRDELLRQREQTTEGDPRAPSR